MGGPAGGGGPPVGVSLRVGASLMARGRKRLRCTCACCLLPAARPAPAQPHAAALKNVLACRQARGGPSPPEASTATEAASVTRSENVMQGCAVARQLSSGLIRPGRPALEPWSLAGAKLQQQRGAGGVAEGSWRELPGLEGSHGTARGRLLRVLRCGARSQACMLAWLTASSRRRSRRSGRWQTTSAYGGVSSNVVRCMPFLPRCE